MNKIYNGMTREQLVKGFDKALDFIIGFYIVSLVGFIIGMVAFVDVNVKLDKANKTIHNLRQEIEDIEANNNNDSNDTSDMNDIKVDYQMYSSYK